MTPRIVAEISGNHGGSLANCRKLIRQAKALKVDSIKFQIFRPVDLAYKRLTNPWMAQALGHKPTLDELRELYRTTFTPRDWWPFILDELDGYPWSASVFSKADLEFALDLDCPQLKIASFEIGDLDLIKACVKTGKALVISASSQASVDQTMAAYDVAPDATFLHATKYYSKMAERDIFIERVEFAILKNDMLGDLTDVGLSDHTTDNRLSVAVRHDAVMIERHIRLEEVDTPDKAFSLTATEFGRMMEAVR